MSLPTKQRIKRPAEFRHVFSRGRRSSNAFTNVVVVPNDIEYLRVGLAVSKRVGNAVTRNLVKRRIRSVVANMNTTRGYDIVVTAKPSSSTVSFSELEKSLRKSAERSGVELTAHDSSVVM